MTRSDGGIRQARRLIATLHAQGRTIDDLTPAEVAKACRNKRGCVLCYGHGCGIEGQPSLKDQYLAFAASAPRPIE